MGEGINSGDWSVHPIREEEALAIEHDLFQIALFGRHIVSHEGLLAILGEWAA